MYNHNDAQNSIRMFEMFSAPALKQIFGERAKIISCERHTSEVEESLDFLAGIDAMIVTHNDLIYFLSSRVQFGGHNYESFSIRCERANGSKTEFAKLQSARKAQATMPTFTVQTFVDADEMAATVGVAYTLDLLRYVENHNVETRYTSTGEKFCVVPFNKLAKVKTFRVSANGNATDLSVDVSTTA